jgi:ubiquinone/menaquinone biosynthesis C-methylase UbiE
MDDLVKPNVENSVSFHQRILVTFLRSFFKLLYHQLAWSYNGVAAIVSLGSWQTWILSTLPYLPGPRVLEIGFGRGNLQAALYPRVAWSVGIDESRQMVEFTHKKLRKAGYHPNLIRGDVFSLPFSSLSFDQVVLTFPAEFILQPIAIKEIHRVLVDGGHAVVLPMAWITGRSPLERLGAWVNRITGEAPEFDEKSLHPLRDYGFQLTWEIIPLSKSKVLIIKMLKSHEGNKIKQNHPVS